MPSLVGLLSGEQVWVLGLDLCPGGPYYSSSTSSSSPIAVNISTKWKRKKKTKKRKRNKNQQRRELSHHLKPPESAVLPQSGARASSRPAARTSAPRRGGRGRPAAFYKNPETEKPRSNRQPDPFPGTAAPLGSVGPSGACTSLPAQDRACSLLPAPPAPPGEGASSPKMLLPSGRAAPRCLPRFPC